MSEAEYERLFQLFKELVDALGVSGFEDEVRGLVAEKFKPHADAVKVDSLGNVVASIKGEDENCKVMLAAHMDEIGLMVSHIESNGFLRFTAVGGVNPATLIGNRVWVKARSGKIKGVVGVKPWHLMSPEEAKKVPELKELFIDIGASSREEAEKMGVRVGDVAVVDRSAERLNGRLVASRAADDRIGVAVLIDALSRVYGSKLPCSVYAVATVQEEVGCRGAQVAAFAIKPTMAIAVDITTANDVAGVSEQDYVVRVGRGPAIKVMDATRTSFLGLIAHPKVREFLVRVAEEEGIPYQLEVLVGGTTDASTIHLTREGVPSGVVSIPTRYAHSPSEVFSLEDAVNASRLIASALGRFRPELLLF
ncbi:M42 family metallopeptidase [Infirmifilum sp. NZ]|uniref:M42 family metallopeptidase n=1 Tax=Infirmifilum sp. NZ TaxID=2926850 RepID=UPI00279A2583|nr:M42 family metallopeptidase [Infirmifilum sp. NZ]UNQ73529.1 M42 family metallopeptidase [Infirmifilum sp. NZ]